MTRTDYSAIFCRYYGWVLIATGLFELHLLVTVLAGAQTVPWWYYTGSTIGLFGLASLLIYQTRAQWKLAKSGKHKLLPPFWLFAVPVSPLGYQALINAAYDAAQQSNLIPTGHVHLPWWYQPARGFICLMLGTAFIAFGRGVAAEVAGEPDDKLTIPIKSPTELQILGYRLAGVVLFLFGADNTLWTWTVLTKTSAVKMYGLMSSEIILALAPAIFFSVLGFALAFGPGITARFRHSTREAKPESVPMGIDSAL